MTGLFTCVACDVSKEYDDLETAMQEFDHAVALVKSRECPNNPRDFRWNGQYVIISYEDGHPHPSAVAPKEPKLKPRETSPSDAEVKNPKSVKSKK